MLNFVLKIARRTVILLVVTVLLFAAVFLKWKDYANSLLKTLAAIKTDSEGEEEVRIRIMGFIKKSI